MRLPRVRRRSPAGLFDGSAYPDSWLFPIVGPGLRQFRKDLERARRKGMRAGVFAKVGDSNMLAYNAFFGLGCREPLWDGQGGLEAVMLRYREVELPPGSDVDFVHSPDAPDRRPWNSFSRSTAAAMMGIVAEHLVTAPERMKEPPHWLREDPDRRPGESALETEIRITRPLYAVIQIGTNGQNYGHSPQRTAGAITDLIRRTRKLGPVPVVFNIPPQINHPAVPTRWEYAEEAARLIAEATVREQAPLVNLWLPLAEGDFVNHGLIADDGVIFDGFHLDTFGGYDHPRSLENSIDFRPEALRYGMNFRNLLLLKVLAELDRVAEDAGRD